ncbi:MAG: translation elongation factor-like protein [Anaerolineae bacterium]|nr:translation elongation factor-like protein [Anaerolineae bacterium]
MNEEYQYVGVVTHYFDRISVAVIQLEGELFVDDRVLIYGPRTELEQQVRSMELEHQKIDRGAPGEDIAIKVDEPVRDGDEVYVILEDEDEEY